MAYEVHTPVFEGPLDVLLHLVMQEHVDIYEVSLSKIVDGYVAYLEQVQVVDLEVATEFLLVAATLLELKARRLLPVPEDVELDEELATWEERDLLLSRLLECKTFGQAAAALERMAARAALSQPRTAGMEDRFVSLMPDLLAGVTVGDLHAAMVRVLAPRPQPRVELDHVAPIRASVADAVEQLVSELSVIGAASFRQLTRGLGRLDLILRFLAVLEMYKDGLVDLEQPNVLGELRVRWVGPSAEDVNGNGATHPDAQAPAVSQAGSGAGPPVEDRAAPPAGEHHG